MDHPSVLLAIVLFVVLRGVLPDPWVLVRTFGRIRVLRAQIAANPANATARRDLARMFLSGPLSSAAPARRSGATRSGSAPAFLCAFTSWRELLPSDHEPR